MKAKISASFCRGFSRALDLSGTKKWPNLADGRKNDYEAIRSDWEHVGRTIENETGKHQNHGVN